MINKYNFEFDKKVIKADTHRLVNQLWKLIPMRENNEPWDTHLSVMIEEISGLNEIYQNQIDFLILLSKLEGLKSEVCNDFMIYRKTVFRCIDLLVRLMPYE
jgi:hypothetical protein